MAADHREAGPGLSDESLLIFLSQLSPITAFTVVPMTRRFSIIAALLGTIVAALVMTGLVQAVSHEPPELGEAVIISDPPSTKAATPTPTRDATPSKPSTKPPDKPSTKPPTRKPSPKPTASRERAKPVEPPPLPREYDDDDDDDDDDDGDD
jgi:outer membrane biosynthesis protein TonB